MAQSSCCFWIQKNASLGSDENPKHDLEDQKTQGENPSAETLWFFNPICYSSNNQMERNRSPVIFTVIVQGAVRQPIHFRAFRLSGYSIVSLQRDDYAFNPFQPSVCGSFLNI